MTASEPRNRDTTSRIRSGFFQISEPIARASCSRSNSRADGSVTSTLSSLEAGSESLKRLPI